MDLQGDKTDDGEVVVATPTIGAADHRKDARLAGRCQAVEQAGWLLAASVAALGLDVATPLIDRPGHVVEIALESVVVDSPVRVARRRRFTAAAGGRLDVCVLVVINPEDRQI